MHDEKITFLVPSQLNQYLNYTIFFFKSQFGCFMLCVLKKCTIFYTILYQHFMFAVLQSISLDTAVVKEHAPVRIVFFIRGLIIMDNLDS